MPRNVAIGLSRIGTYLPPRIVTSTEISNLSGIPKEIIETKFGIHQKHSADGEDHTSALAFKAAKNALKDIAPSEIDLVIYHGSEYKDYYIWSAAAKVQNELKANNAYAFDIYPLCAGTMIALDTAKSMMLANPELRTILLVSACREDDLLDYTNPRASFLYNLGAGGGAMLLRRDLAENVVLASSFITDGTLSDGPIVPGIGTRLPISRASVVKNMSYLSFEVLNCDLLKARLQQVSLPNLLHVIRQAVKKSGFAVSNIAFLAITHTKRSFFEATLDALGLPESKSVYLQDYGHMQSVDQIMALELGLAEGKIRQGDVVVLAGLGTGYTWGATVIRWGRV